MRTKTIDLSNVTTTTTSRFYSVHTDQTEARPAPLESRIRKSPGVQGGAACIRNTRHTVWGLVQWQRMGLSDARILEHHPDLTPADLAEAWRYYGQNRVEIDRAIREHEED
jgi:uncharacterized protein (DUF433 family)